MLHQAKKAQGCNIRKGLFVLPTDAPFQTIGTNSFINKFFIPMRKLIYSCMLVVAACMLFTSCEKEKTFSGTYTFSTIDADAHATATSAAGQPIVDQYMAMMTGEMLSEFKEEFAGASITVDAANQKATFEFEGETEQFTFSQNEGSFTMTPIKDSDFGILTGTINETELIVKEDLLKEVGEDLSDMFEGMAMVDRFVLTMTFVKK